MKAIKALADVLSLTRWRQEQECADLRHLIDDQRKQVVETPESAPMQAIKALADVLSLTRWRQEQESVYTNRVRQGIFCRISAESISVQKARRNHF